jgi:hypothetical protein
LAPLSIVKVEKSKTTEELADSMVAVFNVPPRETTATAPAISKLPENSVVVPPLKIHGLLIIKGALELSLPPFPVNVAEEEPKLPRELM